MSNQTELEKLQVKLVGYAIQIADSFKIKLDYSDKSIKKVEKILSKIHKDYIKSKNDEGLNGIALEFAFYIMNYPAAELRGIKAPWQLIKQTQLYRYSVNLFILYALFFYIFLYHRFIPKLPYCIDIISCCP